MAWLQSDNNPLFMLLLKVFGGPNFGLGHVSRRSVTLGALLIDKLIGRHFNLKGCSPLGFL